MWWALSTSLSAISGASSKVDGVSALEAMLSIKTYFFFCFSLRLETIIMIRMRNTHKAGGKKDQKEESCWACLKYT